MVMEHFRNVVVSKALQWFRFLYRLRNKIIIEIPMRVYTSAEWLKFNYFDTLEIARYTHI